MNKYKAVRIPDHIFEIKKSFVTVNRRNKCKFEFSDNLWLPFIDKLQ